MNLQDKGKAGDDEEKNDRETVGQTGMTQFPAARVRRQEEAAACREVIFRMGNEVQV
jgi:hypothetical protein